MAERAQPGDDVEHFDLAVIGAGAAGLSAAAAAVAAAKRVVLVEVDHFGGECTWSGCVPSKALIEAAHLRHAVARAAAFGIHCEGVRVDFPAVMERVRATVHRIARYEDAPHIAASGVTVCHRRARMVSAGDDGIVVETGGDRLLAAGVILCTGSRPQLPPIPGLAEVHPLTNETVFNLEQLPQHLVILGAGVVGLELGQAFRRLGSEVTVVDMAPSPLGHEDPEVVEVVRAALEREGVRFVLGVTVTAAEAEEGRVRLRLLQGGNPTAVEGDVLLVAAGRRPRTENSGLEELGIAVTPTGITVDDHLQTSLPRVYAAGDCTGLHPFTHAASYQGRIAATNALRPRLRKRADYRVVPRVTFTDPEVASVGLTEAEARDQHGDSVRVARLPFTAVDRAVIRGEADGLIKIVTAGRRLLGHAAGGEVLGAQLVGAGAGELLHEFVLSMQTRSFSGRLAQAMHAYPTLSMGVQQGAAQLFESGRAVAGDFRTELAAELADPEDASAQG